MVQITMQGFLPFKGIKRLYAVGFCRSCQSGIFSLEREEREFCWGCENRINPGVHGTENPDFQFELNFLTHFQLELFRRAFPYSLRGLDEEQINPTGKD